MLSPTRQSLLELDIALMGYCRYVFAMRRATNQAAEYALSSLWLLPSKLAPEYHVDADPSYRSVSAIHSTSIYELLTSSIRLVLRQTIKSRLNRLVVDIG